MDSPHKGVSVPAMPGVNNGPVQVASTNSTPIIATERLGWAVNGTYHQHRRDAGSAFQPVDQQLHLRLVQRCHHGYPTPHRKCRHFQHQCDRHHRWHCLRTLCHCSQSEHPGELCGSQQWAGHGYRFGSECADHRHRAIGLGSQWHLLPALPRCWDCLPIS